MGRFLQTGYRSLSEKTDKRFLTFLAGTLMLLVFFPAGAQTIPTRGSEDTAGGDGSCLLGCME